MQVRKCVDENDYGPIVVHCSAGVGRAGSFVMIDVQLEKYRNEKELGIYSGLTFP
jgi:protein tyrosine phosphatase